MSRASLERLQVWIYLSAILAGVAAGTLWPSWQPTTRSLLWPILLALLFVTFVQVPLLHIRAALRDRRFTGITMGGNFVVIPVIVWALVQWAPPDPAVRLGVLLVLLLPCTDWFITFTQLGGGDTPRAIAVTPLNLLLQLLLLPIYLWWMGDGAISTESLGLALWSAAPVVLLPLVAAASSERWFESSDAGRRLRERLSWWAVPLLASIVFLIAVSEAGTLREASAIWPAVTPVFIAFLLLAATLAKVLARLARLPAAQGRTLAFSFGTRNSFVVLPVALALPQGWETTALVIVMQALVELLGMLLYLWVLPRWLFKAASAPQKAIRAGLQSRED